MDSDHFLKVVMTQLMESSKTRKTESMGNLKTRKENSHSLFLSLSLLKATVKLIAKNFGSCTHIKYS